MQLLNTPHLLSDQKDTEMWEDMASGTVSSYKAHQQQLQDASQLMEQASVAAAAAEQNAAAFRAAAALAQQVQESAQRGLVACMVAEGGASRVLRRMNDWHTELRDLQFQKATLTSMIERGEIGICGSLIITSFVAGSVSLKLQVAAESQAVSAAPSGLVLIWVSSLALGMRSDLAGRMPHVSIWYASDDAMAATLQELKRYACLFPAFCCCQLQVRSMHPPDPRSQRARSTCAFSRTGQLQTRQCFLNWSSCCCRVQHTVGWRYMVATWTSAPPLPQHTQQRV